MYFEDLGGFCIFAETAKVGIFLFEFGNFIDEVQFTKVTYKGENNEIEKNFDFFNYNYVISYYPCFTYECYGDSCFL